MTTKANLSRNPDIMTSSRFALRTTSAVDNPEWWRSANIYQIYPASFLDTNADGLGDLPGIISKIPYLHALNIDALWLSPIYASPQMDMGYDISDYYSIYPPYGTVEDVEILIKGLHGRGMKLIMDLVVNHTSDQHEWFRESRESLDSEKRGWYIWRKGKIRSYIDPSDGETKSVQEPPNNWRSVFGGSAWTLDPATNEYYLHLFCSEQPDLNWDYTPVRQTIYTMMRWWLDKGVDGFRMDVINVISKHPNLPDAPITAPGEKYQSGAEYYACGPRLHEFLQEMHDQTMSRYEGVAIGEMPWVDDENEVLKCVKRGRNELDMIFQFEMLVTCHCETQNLHTMMTMHLIPGIQCGYRYPGIVTYEVCSPSLAPCKAQDHRESMANIYARKRWLECRLSGESRPTPVHFSIRHL